MWSTSFNGGWIADQTIASTGSFVVNCSPTSSGYIFTSSGDGTTGTGNGFYALGRAVRILQGSTTFYGTVASAAVAVGVTTVGLSSGSASGALSTGVAFTSVAVGIETPQAITASATPAATARFHREDGTWAAPTTTATTVVITKYQDTTQFSTSSASYVDITSMSIAPNVSNAANNIRYELYGTCQASAAGNVNFQVLNFTDTVTVVEGGPSSIGAGAPDLPVVLVSWTTQGVGAKTVKGQMKTSSGTAYIAGALGGMTTNKGLVAVEYR